MATANVQAVFSVEVFDCTKLRCERWIQRLEGAFSIFNITDETTQKNYLLHYIGPDTYDLLCDKVSPKKPTDFKYAELVTTLAEHFNPAPLEVAENFRFHKRRQQQGESVNDFLLALRRLSLHCNFGSYLDTALRNQFIYGLTSERLQSRLLEEKDITLPKALQIAVSMELSSQDAAQLHGKWGINAVHYARNKGKKGFSSPSLATNTYSGHDPRISYVSSPSLATNTHSRHDPKISYVSHKTANYKSAMKCFRCGSSNHLANTCKFAKSVCNYCQKVGHLKSVCLALEKNKNVSNHKPTYKGRQGQNGQYVHSVDEVDVDEIVNINLVDGQQCHSKLNDPELMDNTKPVHVSLNKVGPVFSEISQAGKSMSKSLPSLLSIEKEPNEVMKVGLDVKDRLWVNLHINDVPIKMELDSGAAVSIMNASDFYSSFPNVELQKSDIVLTTYCKSMLNVLGYAKVLVSVQNAQKYLNLYIVDSDKHPLFGREWLANLKLDWNTLFNVHTMPNANSSPKLRVQNEKNILNLDNLLSKYGKIFGSDTGEIPGEPAALKFKPNTVPIFIRARPVPFALKGKIDKELDSLESQGILVKVDSSPWGTPIVPVCKSNGQVRLCGDFKTTVNKFLEVDEHPLPTIDELFATMAGGQKFSKIDLRQAYLQMPVRPEDQVALTLSTHKGLYRSTRLMYGLSSAPALWQRKIENILKDIPGVEVFIDDVKVTAPNDQEHLHRLDLVLSRFLKYNLRINLEKSEFLKNEIEYCGYRIDCQGVHKSSSKVEAIQKAPRPKNVSELKSFLGLINYYGRFFKNLSSVLDPLHVLLRKGIPWSWNDACDRAFNNVKMMMQSNDFLVHYSSDLPIVLATDAAPTGVGAVISHIFSDGTERPIQFASQTLTETQRKWSQIDREAYAIVFGVKKFYQYLYGREFLLQCDNRPLTQILSPVKSLPYMSATRMQHYAIFLQGFNYKLKYRSSEANANADFVSRFAVQPKKAFMFDEADLFEIGQIETLPVTLEELSKATSNDSNLLPLLNSLIAGRKCESSERFGIDQTEFTVQRGCVMRGHRVVIPESLRNKVLKELHTAHFGVTRMKALARSFCWWLGIDMDIENLAKNCLSCAKTRKNPVRQSVHPWSFPTKPFERVHLDFAGPFLGKYFLIYIDAFSKWPEVHIVPNITSNCTIQVLRSIFSIFGLPSILVSDNGTQLTSSEFKHFLQANGICHKVTAPYHPATNGQAERYVQTVKSKLTSMMYDSTNVDLNAKLCQFLVQYRITPHSMTGMSPSEILFRYPIKTKFHIMLPKSQTYNKSPFVSNPDSQCKSFEIGSRVAVRNYVGKDKWKFGTVISRKGLLHYEVRLDDGKIWNRHVDQTTSIGSQLHDFENQPMSTPQISSKCFDIVTQPENDCPKNVTISSSLLLDSPSTSSMSDQSPSINTNINVHKEIEIDQSTPALRRSARIGKPVNRLNL